MADPVASTEQDGTVDSLERQSEAHRAQFAHTMDQLRNRVSAKSVRADLKQRASHAGRGILADLERKALDNPLQTAAVGAGLAFPVWRFLQKLPAPLLLLGAGMALAGRESRANEPLERSYSGGAGALSSTAHSKPGQTSGALSKAGSATLSGVDKTTEGAGDESVNAAQRAASAASNFASSSYQAGVDSSSQAVQKIATAGRASREGINKTVERYPLAIGGVGLLLGAALAVGIPASRAENRLFAERSERLRDQMRETAAHAYGEAKAAGERIVENTMDEAREQGLTPQDAEKAMQEADGSARAVADRAAQVVVDEEEASPGKSETTQATGRRDNS